MPKLLLSLIKDNCGATALEYCIIAGLLSILVIAGASTVGTELRSKFTSVSTGLT